MKPEETKFYKTSRNKVVGPLKKLSNYFVFDESVLPGLWDSQGKAGYPSTTYWDYGDLLEETTAEPVSSIFE